MSKSITIVVELDADEGNPNPVLRYQVTAQVSPRVEGRFSGPPENSYAGEGAAIESMTIIDLDAGNEVDEETLDKSARSLIEEAVLSEAEAGDDYGDDS